MSCASPSRHNCALLDYWMKASETMKDLHFDDDHAEACMALDKRISKVMDGEDITVCLAVLSQLLVEGAWCHSTRSAAEVKATLVRNIAELADEICRDGDSTLH